MSLRRSFKKPMIIVGIFLFLYSLLFNGIISLHGRFYPPVAKIKPEYFTVQNTTFIDNYSWLKNYSDPSVKEYLRSENEYSTSMLAKYRDLQNKIRQEMESIEGTDINQIWEYGSWMYYIVQQPDLSYPRYYRHPINSCKFVPSPLDEIVLDYNLFISIDQTYFVAGIFEVSNDNNLLAFGYDLKGNEQFLLRIWDLENRREIEIPEIYTYYSVRWFVMKNRTWIYYNVVDRGIPRIIRRICIRNCEIGRGIELVYEESDLSMTTELKLSADLKDLFIKVFSYQFTSTV